MTTPSPRLTATSLLAAALAASALAPVAAQAAPLELRGAATLRQTDEREVRVTFVTAERLDRTAAGRPDARVVFSDQDRAAVRADGRHGRGHRYAATLRAERDLRAGARYTVRLATGGGASRTLRLTLLDAR